MGGGSSSGRQGVSRELDGLDDDLDADLPERYRRYGTSPPSPDRRTRVRDSMRVEESRRHDLDKYRPLAVTGRGVDPYAGPAPSTENGKKLHTTPTYSEYSDQASHAALNVSRSVSFS